jgi:LPXTG-motif cell wall-anchored protein
MPLAGLLAVLVMCSTFVVGAMSASAGPDHCPAGSTHAAEINDGSLQDGTHTFTFNGQTITVTVTQWKDNNVGGEIMGIAWTVYPNITGTVVIKAGEATFSFAYSAGQGSITGQQQSLSHVDFCLNGVAASSQAPSSTEAPPSSEAPPSVGPSVIPSGETPPSSAAPPSVITTISATQFFSQPPSEAAPSEGPPSQVLGSQQFSTAPSPSSAVLARRTTTAPSALPLTGGEPSTLIALAGLLMASGGGALLVSKKK